MPRIHALLQMPLLALALSLLAVPAGSAAQSSHPCARIADDAARLACYDRQHPPTAAAGPPTSSPPATAPPLPAPTATVAAQPSARFGLPPDPEERPRELQSITAQIREVGALRHGERVFVLDNGQRWAERVAQSRGVLNPGDRVTVERGSFGSFLLVTPGGVGLPVRRLP